MRYIIAVLFTYLFAVSYVAASDCSGSRDPPVGSGTLSASDEKGGGNTLQGITKSGNNVAKEGTGDQAAAGAGVGSRLSSLLPSLHAR